MNDTNTQDPQTPTIINLRLTIQDTPFQPRLHLGQPVHVVFGVVGSRLNDSIDASVRFSHGGNVSGGFTAKGVVVSCKSFPILGRMGFQITYRAARGFDNSDVITFQVEVPDIEVLYARKESGRYIATIVRPDQERTVIYYTSDEPSGSNNPRPITVVAADAAASRSYPWLCCVQLYLHTTNQGQFLRAGGIVRLM